MSEKQELISKLLEMQKKFIDYEHANGVEMEDYFAAEEGHVLKGFRQEYMELANKPRHGGVYNFVRGNW